MINKIIKQAIYAVLALNLTSLSANAFAETRQNFSADAIKVEGMERCYGIAKAGMNDCGGPNHDCSGQAKNDGDKTEWLFVPTGLCKKIVSGSLQQ